MPDISSPEPVRIAMWSGPRNISTAMMRSWGSRPDTVVCDEPLYAHYLKQTGLKHPIADEIIAHHETDWRQIVEGLLGPLPTGKSIFYQKHMTHHLLPEMQFQWLEQAVNCFLIREPKEMLTSLLKVLPNPTLDETGLPQQVRLFEFVAEHTGRTPAVLDAKDVLEHPETMLRKLCEAVGVEFLPAMLEWEAGPRATDGIWARHWYGSVEKSTTFQPYRPKNEEVPQAESYLLHQCEVMYRELHERRLRPSDAD
jgi:Sulfotransferase domain